MSFRALQILLEIYDGYIEKLNLLDFSHFLLFFPSVSSGPVDRYRRFCDDVRQTPDKTAYREQMTIGVWKLMQGLLYNFVFGQLIWHLWLAPLTAHGFLPTLSYMYGYTLYMFFNFAGYSRMAIGTAYLLGVRLPENFDRPFASVDMKDFWAKWHISLSTWLRDYLYTRFCMAALKGKWFKNRRTGSYVGYFITMITMGLWHGITVPYLVYGTYHGILMSANDVLDTKWKAFKKLKKQPIARALMMFVTFHLFSFGLLIFSGRLFA
ncbi:MAG: D-alanyl-lipoteichoic acid biosynthesis protein DltB, partial [Oscillospiraceae bacterium]|nr:D-alanyl-lipoteichoic acid biosynthesis protein DltB [Oscillospiraceae bacterium]